MTKVYRVVGSTGEYNDAQDWTAKTFFDKEKAEQFKKDCQKFADEAHKRKYLHNHDVQRDMDTKKIDENFVIDYNGTYYEIETLEVE